MARASLWIHTPGEEPKKIGEIENFEMKRSDGFFEAVFEYKPIEPITYFISGTYTTWNPPEKGEISSTCPVSDPTASATPPSS